MSINNYFNSPESRFQHAAGLLHAMVFDLNVDNPHGDALSKALGMILENGFHATLWEKENPSTEKISRKLKAEIDFEVDEMQRGIFTEEQRKAENEREEAAYQQHLEDQEEEA